MAKGKDLLESGNSVEPLASRLDIRAAALAPVKENHNVLWVTWVADDWNNFKIDGERGLEERDEYLHYQVLGLERRDGLKHAEAACDQILHNQHPLAGRIRTLNGLLCPVILHLERFRKEKKGEKFNDV
jgi:hypothetical protein